MYPTLPTGDDFDLGPVLRMPCSSCDGTRWFHLKRLSVSAGIVGIELSNEVLYSLYCAECQYHADLSKDDAEKARAFLPIAKAFAENKMKESDFFTKLAAVNFEFLKEFEQANTNWKCLACGEESPMTFSTCWNCGALREGATEEAGEAAPQTPFLDQVMDNEGGPLGPIRL